MSVTFLFAEPRLGGTAKRRPAGEDNPETTASRRRRLGANSFELDVS